MTQGHLSPPLPRVGHKIHPHAMVTQMLENTPFTPRQTDYFRQSLKSPKAIFCFGIPPDDQLDHPQKIATHDYWSSGSHTSDPSDYFTMFI